jgi:hypothetical protein
LKMREKRKDGLPSYGFLLDRDVSKVGSLFPGKRTRTLVDVAADLGVNRLLCRNRTRRLAPDRSC